MATYVIGDIQGCFDTLIALLAEVGYTRDRDRIWLTGDLVNRGPGSLGALRWAASEEGVTAVLGNHDLVLLARSLGVRRPRASDTLDPVLAAPDRDRLLGWLLQRPLIHREAGWNLVHAGLHPSWTLAQAETLAREATEHLREDPTAVLGAWGSRSRDVDPDPDPPTAPDARSKRSAAVLGIVTGIRMVQPDGEPFPAYKGPPDSAPPGLVPWFEASQLAGEGETVLFGHWAALGLYRGEGFVGLDTGCVWGNSLTAFCLETGEVTQVEAKEPRRDA